MTLALPQRCVEALRQHSELQAKDRLRPGELWQDHGLVFESRIGTPLTANNVIRAFRIVTKKAGLGDDWVPLGDEAHLRVRPICERRPVRASPYSRFHVSHVR